MSIKGKIDQLISRRDPEMASIDAAIAKREEVAKILGPSILGDINDDEIKIISVPSDISEITPVISSETNITISDENLKWDVRPEGASPINYLQEVPTDLSVKSRS